MSEPAARAGTPVGASAPAGGTRSIQPDSALLTYFIITSFAAGPFFVFPLLPLYFRYHTLRYEIDDEGITARWGVLFRKEISLTYSRIQDIHLSSNLLERWLGLGKIQIQTASGSAEPELTIQGVKEFEKLRNHLYGRMRGVSEKDHAQGHELSTDDPMTELAHTLREVVSEVRALRSALPGSERR